MATLTQDYTALESQARTSNINRAKAIEEIFDRVIRMYGGGELLLDENQSKQLARLEEREATGKIGKGQQRTLEKLRGLVGEESTFGKSYLDLLEKQKVRDVSSAQQSDISRGLYGLRNRGQEWESSVGAGARLKLEDLLTERLSGALGAKASFLQSIEEPYPDYNALMQANQATASTPTRTINYGEPLSGGGGFGGRTGWQATPSTSTSNATFFGGGGTAEEREQSLSAEYAKYLTHEMQQGHLGYMTFEEYKAQRKL